jgi:hypothetical protein
MPRCPSCGHRIPLWRLWPPIRCADCGAELQRASRHLPFRYVMLVGLCGGSAAFIHSRLGLRGPGYWLSLLGVIVVGVVVDLMTMRLKRSPPR